MSERFALIAGAGDMPAILARGAKAGGASFIAIALTEAAMAPLDGLADKVYRYSVGQMGKIIKTIKKEGIGKVVFIGKAQKDVFFDRARFDLKALKLLKNIKNRNDDTLMLAVVDVFAGEGLETLDQTLYLKELMPGEGILTKRKPTKKEWEDVRYGMDMAKRSASLDLGQTVVVKNRAVLAVEAIEGTDEAIRRGGKYARKGGAVVAKVAKPDQDPRFDVPTVGMTTLASMKEAEAKVLALEAGRTLVVEQEKLVKEADAAGICIVSYKLEED